MLTAAWSSLFAIKHKSTSVVSWR